MNNNAPLIATEPEMTSTAQAEHNIEQPWFNSEKGCMALDKVVCLGPRMVIVIGWYDIGDIEPTRVECEIDTKNYAFRAIKDIDRSDVLALYKEEGRDPEFVHAFAALIKFPEPLDLQEKLCVTKLIVNQTEYARVMRLVEPLDAAPQVAKYIDAFLYKNGPLDDLASELDAQIIFRHKNALIQGRHFALESIDILCERIEPGDVKPIVNSLLTTYFDRLIRTNRKYIGKADISAIKQTMEFCIEAELASLHNCGLYCSFLLNVNLIEDCADAAIVFMWRTQNIVRFILQYISPSIRDTVWLPEWKGDESTKNRAQIITRFHEVALQLRSSGYSQLALIYFVAAALLSDSETVALNAGISCLEAGRTDLAYRFFAAVNRIDEKYAQPLIWPTLNGIPWPHFKMTPEQNADRLLDGAKWPRISVVIPSFNQAAYIEDTILSLVHQNYPNLQLVIVDGASTDGAVDVIERYRSVFDVVIVEPDGGQTDAINKGLAHVDGDLVTWLNTDDMLAPGSLFAVGKARLLSAADLFAGICLEHTDRRLKHVNRTSARPQDFTVAGLAQIFENWFGGLYFYQPEVFFSRDILEKIGTKLDDRLYYSMDYELWLRMAEVGAKLERIPWPISYFRIHPQQKTAAVEDCVEEQSKVRARYYSVVPSYSRKLEVLSQLQRLRERKRPLIAVISSRMSKIFSQEVATEVVNSLKPFADVIFASHVTEEIEESADAALLLVHVFGEEEIIRKLRDAANKPVIVGWFWDNHHHLAHNHAIAKTLDVVVPGHGEFREYLRADTAVQWEPLPLCVTQWSREMCESVFKEKAHAARKSELYGGFVYYAYANERNDFITACVDTLENSAIDILTENKMGRYFDRSAADRFAEWCDYKVSLVVPLKRDLSQRFFDALLAGQIPLVPHEMGDFDDVISKELQEWLPVYRYSMKDIASVGEAHRQALAAFDQGGNAGIMRRHKFAADNHMFDNRIASMARALLGHDGSSVLDLIADQGSGATVDAGGPRKKKDNPAVNTPRSIGERRGKIFVDAQHGLGNRLRALASAATIASKTGRELVVVWQPDHHCEARLSDLFEYEGAVVEEAFVAEAEKQGCTVYNYMEVEDGSKKDAPIVLQDTGDIYARSAYVLNSPFSTWNDENHFLRSLRPVETVRALVASVRQPNDVSAHVRMVGGGDYEHLAYEALENWTKEGHEQTDFWRKKSHFSHFMARLDSLITEGRADRIFVAADKQETYDAFLETFGERVAYLPREVFDRSAEQLRYALADALLLGSSPLLLGSTWSSFSELAMRLSPQKMVIEMSGKDF